MEMEQVMCCVCAFLALLLPYLLRKLSTRGGNGGGLNLPPSPSRLPFIGNFHNIRRNPLVHRAMADIALELGGAPVMSLQLGEMPAVVVSSADAAREVMKLHDIKFASRPWPPTIQKLRAQGKGIFFAPYGVLWRQLRKIAIVKLLSVRRVQTFHRVREEEARRLVVAIAETPPGEAVNVSEQIFVVIADSTMRTMIGGRFERREEFLEVLAEIVKIATGFSPDDLFPSSRLASFIGGTKRRGEVSHQKSYDLVDTAFRQHQERREREAMVASVGRVVKEEDEDLMDELIRMQKEDSLQVPLTVGNIKAVILDLFGAGTETSSDALQWAMSELMRNPRVMQKAQAEVRDSLRGKPMVTEGDLVGLKYLKQIIKETLRLHPVLPLLVPRECQETCKLMGYDVPEGSVIFINAWAISRDPKYWDDAETFKPERFEKSAVDLKGTDFEFIPFGAGRRICPGLAFSLASIEIVLATLLYHFDWELPDGVAPGELDMEEEMGITNRRKNDLRLHATVRVPLQAAA